MNGAEGSWSCRYPASPPSDTCSMSPTLLNLSGIGTMHNPYAEMSKYNNICVCTIAINMVGNGLPCLLSSGVLEFLIGVLYLCSRLVCTMLNCRTTRKVCVCEREEETYARYPVCILCDC